MSALLKKLKFPANSNRIAILDAPDDFIKQITSSFPFDIDSELQQAAMEYHYILSFVWDEKSLAIILPSLINKIGEKGMLWIAYPKKSSAIKTDLNRDRAWDIFTSFNYRPVNIVSIDETWSAIRIKPVSEVKVRPKPKIREIDYDARKVFPPENVQAALKSNALTEVFNSLSFTHKKEHIEAIVLAKK